MYYDENNRPFDYETVLNNWNELQNTDGINEITLDNNVVNRISNLLNLKGCENEDSIRGIRNAVVKMLNKREKEALHIDPNTNDTIEGYILTKEDYNDFREASMLMSAITAVIDNELWKRGYAV